MEAKLFNMRKPWLSSFKPRSHYAGKIGNCNFNSTVRPAVHTNPSRKRSFSKTMTSRWSSDCSVLKFLRRSVDGKHLMRFQSENTVVKFLRRSVDETLNFASIQQKLCSKKQENLADAFQYYWSTITTKVSELILLSHILRWQWTEPYQNKLTTGWQALLWQGVLKYKGQHFRYGFFK